MIYKVKTLTEGHREPIRCQIVYIYAQQVPKRVRAELGQLQAAKIKLHVPLEWTTVQIKGPTGL